MNWLITIGVLFLLSIIPLGASIIYDEDGPLVRLIAGPLKLQIIPVRKKVKKPKQAKKRNDVKKTNQEKTNTTASANSVPQQTSEKPKKKSGGPITDFLPLVSIVLKFLDSFRRKLRVNVLELKLIMAADDPCDLAVNYGRAWAAVGNLMPQLERVFVIQKRDIEVECDFTADKTRVLARLDLTITLGRILGLVFALVGRALVELIKIVMKRKGGAVNEPKSS